jgi:hypothetical protein
LISHFSRFYNLKIDIKSYPQGGSLYSGMGGSLYSGMGGSLYSGILNNTPISPISILNFCLMSNKPLSIFQKYKWSVISSKMLLIPETRT